MHISYIYIYRNIYIYIFIRSICGQKLFHPLRVHQHCSDKIKILRIYMYMKTYNIYIYIIYNMILYIYNIYIRSYIYIYI